MQIAFTSGSTGTPTAHAKRWGSLHFNTRFNAERIRECLDQSRPAARPGLIATVPPQHMYGTETSVLLPLLAGMAVHAARPLFPEDVAVALAEVPEPRVLVTTPVHLRTLLAANAGVSRPRRGGLGDGTDGCRSWRCGWLSAWAAPLLEMFGSTETCVIASRLTARESGWRLYPGVTLEPAADHAWVRAPWFDQPTRLQDVVEIDRGRPHAAAGSQCRHDRDCRQARLAVGSHAAAAGDPRRARCGGVPALGCGDGGAGCGAGAAGGGGRGGAQP